MAEVGEPQALPVDARLRRILDAAGLIDIPQGATLVVVPPLVDIQWFINHPSPQPDTEEVWAALAAPSRREATLGQIREARKEVRALEATLKRQIRLQHAGAASSRLLRSNLTSVTAETAQQVEQCRAIYATLTATEKGLDRVWRTFRHKFITTTKEK